MSDYTKEQSEERAAYQRRRRADLKAKGLCKECAKRKIYRSCRCRVCYPVFVATNGWYVKRWRDRKVAKGLCSLCGKRKATKSFSTCAPCREKWRESGKIAKANGICSRCRKRKVQGGLVTCHRCRTMKRKWRRQAAIRKRP